MDLTRKRERDRLSARREPYWHRFDKGAALGFRCGPDTWVLRYTERAEDAQWGFKKYVYGDELAGLPLERVTRDDFENGANVSALAGRIVPLIARYAQSKPLEVDEHPGRAVLQSLEASN